MMVVVVGRPETEVGVFHLRITLLLEWSDKPDDHEESELQEAILASMAAKIPQGTGKQPPTFLACKKPLMHTTPQPTAGSEEKAAA